MNALSEFGEKFLIGPKTLKKIDFNSSNYSKITLFGILFCSNFHPSFKQIIENLINFYNRVNNDSCRHLEIIYCSCDELEEEFNMSVSSQMPWLVIPYDNNDIKEQLFTKYSVDSIPLLVIIDKEGKIIISLNKTEIDLLDDNSFSGWINMSSLNKKLLKQEKYKIGQKGISMYHPHHLIYTDETLKMPDYKGNSWVCDVCGTSHQSTVPNFYCGLCGFDICDNCFEKNNS